MNELAVMRHLRNQGYSIPERVAYVESILWADPDYIEENES